MAEKPEGIPDEACTAIPDRVKILQSKREKIKKRQEELDGVHKWLVEEHLRLDEAGKHIEEEIKVINDLVSECNKKECGIDFREYLAEIEEEEAEEEKKRLQVVTNMKKTCRFTNSEQHSNQKYVKLNKKKKIRTLLHHILDIVNDREKVKVRELASEVDMPEAELLVWAKVMDERNILKLAYNRKGDHVLKKI